MTLYYALEFARPSDEHPRFDLVVIDYDRGQRFSCGVTYDPSAAKLFTPGAQAFLEMLERRCESRLWSGIKQESPGTFLEARSLGWLRRDEPPHA